MFIVQPAVVVALVAFNAGSFETGVTPPDDVRQEKLVRDAKFLAQLLNPKEYGTSVMLGAQAELLPPAAGTSSLVIGYDSVRFQTEFAFGLAAGRDILFNTRGDDAYLLSVRLAVPVHRGIRADFGLQGTVGVDVINPAHSAAYVVGTFGLGARIRYFVSPNIATVASLGAIVLVGQQTARVLVGARPLGSAGVLYFFR